MSAARSAPRSTPFPYTTLFRSCPLPCPTTARWRRPTTRPAPWPGRRWPSGSATYRRCWAAPSASWWPCGAPRAGRPRSEEHTSELQSLAHLVCRLLLEKKNEHGLVPDAPTVYGLLSLIACALIFLVSIKFVVFILRLDNDGEGVILALLALVLRSLWSP